MDRSFKDLNAMETISATIKPSTARGKAKRKRAYKYVTVPETTQGDCLTIQRYKGWEYENGNIPEDEFEEEDLLYISLGQMLVKLIKKGQKKGEQDIAYQLYPIADKYSDEWVGAVKMMNDFLAPYRKDTYSGYYDVTGFDTVIDWLPVSDGLSTLEARFDDNVFVTFAKAGLVKMTTWRGARNGLTDSGSFPSEDNKLVIKLVRHIMDKARELRIYPSEKKLQESLGHTGYSLRDYSDNAQPGDKLNCYTYQLAYDLAKIYSPEQAMDFIDSYMDNNLVYMRDLHIKPLMHTIKGDGVTQKAYSFEYERFKQMMLEQSRIEGKGDDLKSWVDLWNDMLEAQRTIYKGKIPYKYSSFDPHNRNPAPDDAEFWAQVDKVVTERSEEAIHGLRRFYAGSNACSGLATMHDRFGYSAAAIRRAESMMRTPEWVARALVLNKYNMADEQFIYKVLDSPAEFAREAMDMDNCLIRMKYDQKVLRGDSVIYSIRTLMEPDCPIADIEVDSDDDDPTHWRQFYGPHNNSVPQSLKAAFTAARGRMFERIKAKRHKVSKTYPKKLADIWTKMVEYAPKGQDMSGLGIRISGALMNYGPQTDPKKDEQIQKIEEIYQGYLDQQKAKETLDNNTQPARDGDGETRETA